MNCGICKISEATIFVNADGNPTKNGKCEACHARAIRNSVPKQKRGRSGDRGRAPRENGEGADRRYQGDSSNGEW